MLTKFQSLISQVPLVKGLASFEVMMERVKVTKNAETHAGPTEVEAGEPQRVEGEVPHLASLSSQARLPL